MMEENSIGRAETVVIKRQSADSASLRVGDYEESVPDALRWVAEFNFGRLSWPDG